MCKRQKLRSLAGASGTFREMSGFHAFHCPRMNQKCKLAPIPMEIEVPNAQAPKAKDVNLLLKNFFYKNDRQIIRDILSGFI